MPDQPSTNQSEMNDNYRFSRHDFVISWAWYSDGWENRKSVDHQITTGANRQLPKSGRQSTGNKWRSLMFHHDVTNSKAYTPFPRQTKVTTNLAPSLTNLRLLVFARRINKATWAKLTSPTFHLHNVVLFIPNHGAVLCEYIAEDRLN
jgi:hypothetical protein